MLSTCAFTLLAMIAVSQLIKSEGSVRSFILGPSEHEEMMEKQVSQYNHATEMKRLDLESQDKILNMMQLNESLQRHDIDRKAEVQLAQENTKKHEASAGVLVAQHVAEQEKWKAIQSSNDLQMLEERARIRIEEERTKQAEELSRQIAEERRREQMLKERIEMELRLAELQKEQIEREMKIREAERSHELELKKIEQKMREDEQTHEMHLTVIKALAVILAACIVPSFQIYKHFFARQQHRANQGDYRQPAAPPDTPPNAPTEVETDQTTDTSDVADNTTATPRGRSIAEVGSATKSELTPTRRNGFPFTD